MKKAPFIDDENPVADPDVEDIFSRPSGFRKSVVLEVWEKADRLSPEQVEEINTAKDENGEDKYKDKEPEHYRSDWRNGIIVGAWEPLDSNNQLNNRDDIWDMGHREAWYKVVERLRKVDGITREDVLDEFNNIENLGAEDPETNRRLGSGSGLSNKEPIRHDYAEEESILFEGMDEGTRETQRKTFHSRIDEAAEGGDRRVEALKEQIPNRSGKPDATAPDDEEKEMTEKHPNRVVVWDCETTGLSHKNGDKMVQVAAIEVVDGEIKGEYTTLINPERTIPKRASDVHNITDEKVKDAPIFKDMSEEFLAFLGDAPLVAHNATFDMGFLNAELKHIGKDPIGSDRKIDTLKMARKVLPDLETHTLDAVAKAVGVNIDERADGHDAMVDTKILANVYLKLSEMEKEKDKASPSAQVKDDEISESEQEQEAIKTERSLQALERSRLSRMGLKPESLTDRSHVQRLGDSKQQSMCRG